MNRLSYKDQYTFTHCCLTESVTNELEIVVGFKQKSTEEIEIHSYSGIRRWLVSDLYLEIVVT